MKKKSSALIRRGFLFLPFFQRKTLRYCEQGTEGAMLKILSVLFLIFSAYSAQARTIKMGAMPGNPNMIQQQQQQRRQRAEAEAAARQTKARLLRQKKSRRYQQQQQQQQQQPETPQECLSTDDCPYNQECVALECRSVCYPDSCPSDKRCTAFKDRPHTYECVDCLRDGDCPDGQICSQDTFTCEKDDPCRKAVCFQDAPYCVPVAYKSLPYTCVQCTEDAHCPPVAGLSRSCVKNSCLFNVAGNIPADSKTVDDENKKTERPPRPAENAAPAAEPAVSRITETPEKDIESDDIPYDDEETEDDFEEDE